MWRHVIVGIGLIAATWLVYLPVADFDFVNLDDPAYVAENPYVQTGLNTTNIAWAARTTHLANWHPLTWLSLMADAELFGTDPGVFHLGNLSLHTINALLLYAVLWQMTGAVWSSACVAALFAIHPLHVESVAWISERKDVLSTLFGLVAMSAYTRYARAGKWMWYAASLLAFAASLLAKQMLVTLPCLLLLLDVWPLSRTRWNSDAAAEPSDSTTRQSWGRLLAEKVPFFALSALFSILIYVTQSTGGSVQSLAVVPLGTRISNAVVAYVLYLAKTIWPAGLAVLYPHPGDIPVAEVATAGAILAIITAAVLLTARRRPYLPVGWFWYLGTLFPVIGLIQIGDHQLADRYSYFPLIGVFIAVTWLLASLASRAAWLRGLIAVGVCVTLGALTVAARAQVDVWRDSQTLFTHTIAVTGENPVAHFNLGAAYEELGQLDTAADEYRRTLQFAPSYAAAHHNLGNVRLAQNRYGEAIDHYRAAIEIDPEFSDAHNNLGNALRESGRREEAMAEFRTAVEIDPNHPAAHGNLASLLFEQGRLDEALRHFREAVRSAPDSVSPQINLATALSAAGSYEEAARHFRHALEIEPDNESAAEGLVLTYANWGTTLAAAGKLTDASRRLYQALELDADAWLARYNLSRVLQLQNKPRQAEAELRKVLKLNPDLAEAHNDLGLLLLHRGNKDAAITRFRRAMKLKPDFAAAQQNLERATGEQDP